MKLKAIGSRLNTMKCKLIVLVSLLLVSCCQKTTTTDRTDLPPAPPVRESIIPNIDKIEESNRQLRQTVAKQDKTIVLQRDEIDRAILLAEQIRKNLAESLPVEEVDAANLIAELNKN